MEQPTSRRGGIKHGKNFKFFGPALLWLKTKPMLQF
jgi:hypothetical protein